MRFFTCEVRTDDDGNPVFIEHDLDSTPDKEGVWIPPLDTVRRNYESLEEALEHKEALQLRVDEIAELYLKIVGRNLAHARTQEDVLRCSQTEEGFQDNSTRSLNLAIRLSTGDSDTGASGPPEILDGVLLDSFHKSPETMGYLLRPGIDELERRLDCIPVQMSDQKSKFRDRHDEGMKAEMHRSWAAATEKYEECIDILGQIESSLPVHVHTWLLFWICIPLAFIYQLVLQKHADCVDLLDRLLQCLNLELDQEAGTLYYEILWHRRLALYDWSHTIAKSGDLLLAQFLSAKAFGPVQEGGVGCTTLTIILNRWGRGNGMRPAFCANLEELYADYALFDDALYWMKEKRKWIPAKPGDLPLNLRSTWSLQMMQDISILINAGKLDDAEAELAKMKQDVDEMTSTEGPSEPKHDNEHWKVNVVRFGIRIFEAKCLRLRGKTSAARTNLRKLKIDVENSIENHGSVPMLMDVLTHLRQELYYVFTEDVLTLPTYIGSEETDRNNDRLSFVDLVLNEVTPGDLGIAMKISLTLDRSLMVIRSLCQYIPARNLKHYDGRVRQTIADLRTCLKELDSTSSTFKPHTTHLKRCHTALGLCYRCATVMLKDRKLGPYKENPLMELPFFNDVYLEKAIFHCREAVRLDPECQASHGQLGLCLAEKAIAWYERLTKMACDILPKYKDILKRNTNRETRDSNFDIHQVGIVTQCRNPHHKHLFVIKFGEKLEKFAYTETYFSIYGQELREHRTLFTLEGRTNFALEENIDDLQFDAIHQHLPTLISSAQREYKAAFEGAVKHLRKSSVDHSNSTVVSTPEQRRQQMKFAEVTRQQYTFLQRLMGHQKLVNFIEEFWHLRTDLDTSTSTSGSQHLNGSCMGLVWAERSRARSFFKQLLERSSDHATSEAQTFDTDDDAAWDEIRAARANCGPGTVFLEYTYDTQYQFSSEVDQSDIHELLVHSFVYVLGKDGQVKMHESKQRNPDVFLRELHLFLSKTDEYEKNESRVGRILEDLYKLLIAPIADSLKDMLPEDNLIIAVDEVLTNVPFAVLRDRDGHYLVEKHTISLVPSLRILGHCHRRLKALENFPNLAPSVALGDPAASTSSDNRLEETVTEVTTIAKLFNVESDEGAVKVLLGLDATIDNLLRVVRLPSGHRQGFVHVAAHGKVDKDYKTGALSLANPRRVKIWPPRMKGLQAPVEIPPGIADAASSSASRRVGGGLGAIEDPVLSDSEGEGEYQDCRSELELHHGEAEQLQSERSEYENRPSRRRDYKSYEADVKKGMLRAEAIVDLVSDCRSYIVVLSACNTAKGSLFPSEGVINLPRAFMISGAPCAVVSQWELDDKSSATMMGEFYSALRQGNDVASALRSSMLYMLRSNYELYKWGASVVWGLPTVRLPSPMLHQ